MITFECLCKPTPKSIFFSIYDLINPELEIPRDIIHSYLCNIIWELNNQGQLRSLNTDNLNPIFDLSFLHREAFFFTNLVLSGKAKITCGECGHKIQVKLTK